MYCVRCLLSTWFSEGLNCSCIFGTQFNVNKFLIFSCLGDYPQGVALEFHLFILCAYFYVCDFVSFNCVGCQFNDARHLKLLNRQPS
jgi:hypothetical protein